MIMTIVVYYTYLFQFMIQANAYIKQLESERRLLQEQVKRLVQENQYLRKEAKGRGGSKQANEQTSIPLQILRSAIQLIRA